MAHCSTRLRHKFAMTDETLRDKSNRDRTASDEMIESHHSNATDDRRCVDNEQDSDFTTIPFRDRDGSRNVVGAFHKDLCSDPVIPIAICNRKVVTRQYGNDCETDDVDYPDGRRHFRDSICSRLFLAT